MTAMTVDIFTYSVADINNTGYYQVYYEGFCAGIQDNTNFSPESVYGYCANSIDDPTNQLYTSVESMITINYAFKTAEVISDFASIYTSVGYTFSLGVRYPIDISDGTVYKSLLALIDAKYALPTPGDHIASVATNAVDSNPTNYNVLTGLLGLATALNNANTNQNAMADQVNDLATKFNTLLSHLTTLGLQA